MRFVKVRVGGEVKSTSTPAPGTRWRPIHRTPHGNNKTISIRRFIARETEKKKNESIEYP